MKPYSKQLYVGWAHLDANGHMANTAYLALAADVRMFYFAENGFPSTEFGRLALGPVIQRETLEYRRELRLLEPIEVTLALDGLSPDAARWILVNEFIRSDGQVAARVTSTGGWLDLRARALVPPHASLAEVLRAAPRTAAFTELQGLGPPPVS
jgi:acyl-CoA thioester hydrolase